MGYSRIGDNRRRMSAGIQDVNRKNSLGKPLDQTQYLTTHADTGCSEIDISRFNASGFDDSIASPGNSVQQGNMKDPKRSNFISNPFVSPVN